MIEGRDLLSDNGGEIDPVLFPSESSEELEARLGRYVSEGYMKVGEIAAKDNATKAWAYHRAYMAVYLRMSAAPTASELVDQSRVRWDPEQAPRFYDLAKSKLEEFNVLVSQRAPTPAFNSGGIRTRFSW